MSICNLHFRLLWWILLITGRSRTAPSFPAGDLETHPGLSRHHPVEHFLGKAFPKAHYAHLSPVTTCCPGFCQGSQLGSLPFVTECCLFPPGAPKHPESTELLKSHCSHTFQSNSSLSPGPQSLWWWWRTARLPHSVLSPPAFITIIRWAGKPTRQVLFRGTTAKTADGSKSISVLLVLSAGLSAMSQPYLRRERAGILEDAVTFSLSWVTALSSVCKWTAGIRGFISACHCYTVWNPPVVFSPSCSSSSELHPLSKCLLRPIFLC